MSLAGSLFPHAAAVRKCEPRLRFFGIFFRFLQRAIPMKPGFY